MVLRVTDLGPSVLLVAWASPECMVWGLGDLEMALVPAPCAKGHWRGGRTLVAVNKALAEPHRTLVNGLHHPSLFVPAGLAVFPAPGEGFVPMGPIFYPSSKIGEGNALAELGLNIYTDRSGLVAQTTRCALVWPWRCHRVCARVSPQC